MLNRYQTLPEMFRTLALLCLVAAPALGTYEGNLKVRFGLDLLKIGTTVFIEQPKNTTQAAAKGYVQKTSPERPDGYSSLDLWCSEDDCTVGLLYDDTGYIAGLQIGLDVDLFTYNVYDWDAQGYVNWTIELNGVSKTYRTMTIYFVSTDTLETTAATRIANRDSNLMLQDTAIYVPGYNGELVSIPTNVSGMGGDDSNFTKQSCIPWMGQHYYYKMTTDLVCSAENLLSFFPLTWDDQLIGVGFMNFGNRTVETNVTNYFEAPTASEVELIVPSGPQCLYDIASTPGVVTMHIYFIDTPYLLFCL